MMDIKVSAAEPTTLKNACIVVPLHEGKKMTGAAANIDAASGKAISRAIKRGDVSSRNEHCLMLHELPGIATERLLVVGAGNAKENTLASFRKWCACVAASLNQSGASDAAVHLEESLFVAKHNAAWHAQQLAQALIDAQYQFTLHSKKKPDAHPLKKCTLIVSKSDVKTCKVAVLHASGIANGSSVARDLGNLAPNICTPSYLAKFAQSMAKSNAKLTTKIVDEAQMKKLGMGAFLSVSQGSTQPAKLICMEYNGAPKKQKPIVLLGKGVTFDTGGISIKPSAGMDEMKFDMCGAASVFGAMQAICEIKPNCNVIGVVAAAENMPDGDASRPGDVITTMSGQTVEILNTDAEGRLVLCDSLTYIERYKPAAVIDVATLTGACIVALGHFTTAVMSNDETLGDALYEAGQSTGDLTWPLPLWDEYQSQLDSNFADMGNIGGSAAGTITAGCFLSRFAKKYPWAHLDIAGVAWKSGKEKGATGRPVPLLLEYVLNNS